MNKDHIFHLLCKQLCFPVLWYLLRLPGRSFCYHSRSSDLTASQFLSWSFLGASGTEGRDGKGRNPLVPPRASSCLALVRGNKRHVTTPLLVSPRKMTFEKRAQYWWRVTTQIWVMLLTGKVFVCLTGWSKFPMRLDQKKKKKKFFLWASMHLARKY